MAECLLILGLVVLALPCALAVRSLLFYGAGKAWWRALGGSVLAGLVLSIYLDWHTWMTDPAHKAQGIPVPLVIFELRDGRWVDFVSPISPFVNAVFFAFVAVLPVVVLSWIRFGFCLRQERRMRGFPVDPSSGHG